MSQYHETLNTICNFCEIDLNAQIYRTKYFDPKVKKSNCGLWLDSKKLEQPIAYLSEVLKLDSGIRLC